MHEASIALSVLDTVTEECRKHGYAAVESVRLRIGKASGILPEALTFAFDIAKAETIAREARLVIDLVPVGGQCPDCRTNFEVEERFLLECPGCHGTAFTVTQGYELDIVDMEVN
ncbi:MAG: hydrogenase maturation nickel metallochaperone HypA [Desulfobulbaceae bacterium]|nr:hydrogenase maturation nickel metallochaperone HypA [Desulfobulbaceae bacterium]